MVAASPSPRPTLCSDRYGPLRVVLSRAQCDYDPEIRNSRCFCNEGWTGGDCSQQSQPAPTGLSAIGAVLLTVSLLLVATLVFL